MIPLRDSTRSHKPPILTVLIIILNLYIFLRQIFLDPNQLTHFINSYAFIPAHLAENIRDYSLPGLFHPQLVTSFFLHGSLFHVLSNMLYLWIFGDNIEDKLGRVRFLLFYLLTGVFANLTQFLIDPSSPIPVIGASGAVAGILGAYFITFPRAKVTSLLFIFIFFTIRDIPAIYFLFIWFIIQVFSGISSLGTNYISVAWWAHIGGFLTGIILMLIMRKRNKTSTL